MYNTKEGKSCVIYIRVSSERQVKGYSLDGQKHYLAECAERRGMTVLDTYVEEGKSGKSIEGRTEFQRMLDDIQSGDPSDGAGGALPDAWRLVPGVGADASWPSSTKSALREKALLFRGGFF